MNTDPDNSAMNSLLSGNDKGLDEIMARWKGPIAAYLYRMLGNTHDALDLAQEVCVKVYFERARFDRGKPFGPWIYTIASNLAKNRLRWRCRHKSEELNEMALPASSPAEGEYEGLMMDCLQKIPAEFREVVILFDIEERPHEEIARIIGKSRKTVEARLYKGRELLKRAYLAAAQLPAGV
jgi:RNA polymerase sigma-70 factor (ECF subfamily)